MKKIRILDTVVIVCGVPALWAALQYLRGTFEGAERVVVYLVAIAATGVVVKGIYFLIQGKAREKSEEFRFSSCPSGPSLHKRPEPNSHQES